jgi:acetylornithine deacetylase/succinyl-diaminopimelate desuccinylase-like protein
MLAGVEAVLATAGRLPVNLKVVIEGEEEIGSPHLADLIRRRADEFAADVVVLADASLDPLGRPTIVTSARGLIYTFVTVRGPGFDLHSGEYGGVVANPANGLARLIAGLHDAAGRITLDGFYDGVEELDPQGRAQLEALPYTEQDVAGKAGVARLGGGETGRPFIERRWYRPTCDVNGLTSGYQGPGAKTIIPSTAQAKISFRLVGRQDPDRIIASFRRYLADHCPAGLAADVEVEHPCRAYQADASGPAFGAIAEAIRAVTGGEPTWAGAGGTIPIMADFKQILGAESVYLGLAREDCFLHAPNEQMNVEDYFRGGEISATLWPLLVV